MLMDAVSHASDIGYLHGGVWLDPSTSPSAKLASVMIMNYALSFAASLDPNDGRGIQGSTWSANVIITPNLIVCWLYRTELGGIREQ